MHVGLAWRSCRILLGWQGPSGVSGARHLRRRGDERSRSGTSCPAGVVVVGLGGDDHGAAVRRKRTEVSPTPVAAITRPSVSRRLSRASGRPRTHSRRRRPAPAAAGAAVEPAEAERPQQRRIGRGPPAPAASPRASRDRARAEPAVAASSHDAVVAEQPAARAAYGAAAALRRSVPAVAERTAASTAPCASPGRASANDGVGPDRHRRAGTGPAPGRGATSRPRSRRR